MTTSNSTESQVKHEAHESQKGGERNQALQHVTEQAHTMSSKDLKAEQSYWNAVNKPAHDNLPAMKIHQNNDGSVGIHDDGSVSISSEHNGVTTQEKYNKDSSKETKVTRPDQSSKTTFKDSDGRATKTVEHANLGDTKSQEITYAGDGTTKKIEEKTTTDGDKSTTRNFREDGTRSKQIEKGPDGTTETKYGPKGTNDRSEKVETDNQGFKTTTSYDAQTHQRVSQHKETTDGYIDRKFKPDGSVESSTEHKNKPDGKGFVETETRNGKLVSTIDRTNGQKGAYNENRNFPANEKSTERNVEIGRSPVNANGSFTEDRVETQGKNITTYAMNMTDENHGIGSRIKIGPQVADSRLHKVKFEDGRYTEVGS